MNLTFKHCLAASVVALAASSASAQVIAGPITNPANGHHYFVVGAVNPGDYYARAQAIGGYPAVINNAAENAWVAQTMIPLAGGQMLIGLADAAFEGDFRWVNANGALDSYTNWASGEPNNFGNEDLTNMQSNGTWNDVPFDSFRYTLVEANPIGSQPTGIFAGPVCDPRTGHVYYLLTVANWGGAEAFAQTLGGHLATIDSNQENLYLMRNLLTLPNTGQYVTIGLNDRLNEGNFTWPDSSGAGFRLWASTEPNNAGNEDFVVVLTDITSPIAGQWYDIGDQPRISVVEVVPPTFCPADINRSGTVSVQDIFDFLAAYFSGC